MIPVSLKKSFEIVEQLVKHLDQIQIGSVDDLRGIKLNTDSTYNFRYKGKSFLLGVKSGLSSLALLNLGPLYTLKLIMDDYNTELVDIYPYRTKNGFVIKDPNMEALLSKIEDHIVEMADRKVSEKLGDNFFDE